MELRSQLDKTTPESYTRHSLTRQLAGKNKHTSRPVRDKQGNLLTQEYLQLQRWEEYFQEIVNRPPPDSIPDTEKATEDLNINCGRISKEEIKRAIKSYDAMQKHLELTIYHLIS